MQMFWRLKASKTTRDSVGEVPKIQRGITLVGTSPALPGLNSSHTQLQMQIESRFRQIQCFGLIEN